MCSTGGIEIAVEVEVIPFPRLQYQTSSGTYLERENTQNDCNILITGTLIWWRWGGESNDKRLLILRNLLRIYERKNRKTLCMAPSVVQNHAQNFEGPA